MERSEAYIKNYIRLSDNKLFKGYLEFDPDRGAYDMVYYQEGSEYELYKTPLNGFWDLFKRAE